MNEQTVEAILLKLKKIEEAKILFHSVVDTIDEIGTFFFMCSMLILVIIFIKIAKQFFIESKKDD